MLLSVIIYLNRMKKEALSIMVASTAANEAGQDHAHETNQRRLVVISNATRCITMFNANAVVRYTGVDNMGEQGDDWANCISYPIFWINSNNLSVVS